MHIDVNNSYERCNTNLASNKEDLTENWPLAVFHKILSNLDAASMQTVTLVSRLWKNESIDTAKREEFKLINDLLSFIREKFPEVEKAKLFTLDNNNAILGSVNLLQLKSSVFSLKDQVIKILYDLETCDLDLLESTFIGRSNRKFYEILFDIARIYKKVDEEVAEAKKISYSRKEALFAIAIKLVNIGFIDKAVKVILELPSYEFTGFGKFVESISVDQAAEIILKLPSDNLNNHPNVLEDISKKLMQSGNIDKAIEIALKISENIFKYHALKYICEELAENGNVSKLLSVAHEITNLNDKRLVFSNILRKLMENEKIDIAAEIVIKAPPIYCNLLKNYTLKDLSKKLMQNGNVTKAVEIALKIIDFDTQSKVLEDISRKLMKSGKIDEAVEIARKIMDFYTREEILEDISKELGKNGNFDKAIEVSYKLSGVLSPWGILLDISDELEKSRNVDKEIEFALKVSENTEVPEHDKDSLLRKVSMGLAKRGIFDKAEDVANKIKDDDERISTLEKIRQGITD